MSDAASLSNKHQVNLDLVPLDELNELEFFSLIWQTPWRMLSLGARLRSLDVLELLAGNGTQERLSWNELHNILKAARTTSDLVKHDIPHLICSVLLACVLDPTPENFNLAARIVRLTLVESRLSSSKATEALRLSAQIATLNRSAELFEELTKYPFLDPTVVWAGRTDFLRPDSSHEWQPKDDSGVPSSVFQKWWTSFNEPFTSRLLTPFTLRPEDITNPESVFSAITVPETTPASIPVDEQELVTIIVPTYCPDEGFLNTIDSLTRQSWSNIEVLIVDDCSPTGQEYLEAAEQSDPRVRVIPQEINGGAYRARNRGLNEALGEFVTFQDADDLSHPQRIEHQVLPLRNPSRIASVSRSQRVLSDGSLTYFGYLPHRVNASSLLFKRKPVLEQLGGFDDVRKGADSEFTERLLRAFGRDSFVELAEPLSLVQLTFGSLSRSDFFPFWMSGSRRSYLRQFRAAHRAIAEQSPPNWVISEKRPAICRSAPRMRGASPDSHLATAVVSDWGINIEAYRDTAGHLHDLLPSNDETIGLLNGIQPRFRSPGSSEVRPEITTRVESGEFSWMNWADETHVNTLVFENPEYLWAMPRRSENGITADSVTIVLDETLRHAGSHKLPPITWCEERVFAHFGVKPQWLVRAPGIFSYLTAKGCDVEFREQVPSSFRCSSEISRKHYRNNTRLVIGVPLPSKAEGANWDLHSLTSHLPEPDVAETIFYDPSAIFEARNAGSCLDNLGRFESSREVFLQRVDVLLPDLFGQHLIGTESWLRDCGPHGVAALLPYGIQTSQDSPIVRYAMLGSREFLSALAVDPHLAQHLVEASAVSPEATHLNARQSIRFLIFGSDDAAVEKTIASVRRLKNIPRYTEIITAECDIVGELRSNKVFASLSPGDRFCLVLAGTEFEPDAFERLSQTSFEDIHVFTDASGHYSPDEENIAQLSTIIATEDAPLWTGSTPLLLRADVLAAVIRKHPRATTKGFMFAAALSLVGGFGVLGGTRAPRSHEEQANKLPETDHVSWYLDFARDWTELLASTSSVGSTSSYLQRVFVSLLSLQNNLVLSYPPMLGPNSLEWRTYCEAIGQALQYVDDRFLCPQESVTPLSPQTLQFQLFLLRLKHGKAFSPTQATNDVGATTVFADLTLEQPASTQVTTESIESRDGVLTIRGSYPIAFEYKNHRLKLRVGTTIHDLPTQRRHSEFKFQGTSCFSTLAFSAQIPLSNLPERIFFQFNDGSVVTPALNIEFAYPAAKLSHYANDYFAIPPEAILIPTPHSIYVVPYSKFSHFRLELRRRIRACLAQNKKPEANK